jgi:hypothetical protein
MPHVFIKDHVCIATGILFDIDVYFNRAIMGQPHVFLCGSHVHFIQQPFHRFDRNNIL